MVGTRIHKKDIEEMLEQKFFPQRVEEIEVQQEVEEPLQRVEEKLNKLKITSPNTKGPVIHFHRK